MYGFEDDDGPEKSEAPDIADVVEESGLDYTVGANEPVEGGEGRGCVVRWDPGCGVGRSGHCCGGR